MIGVIGLILLLVLFVFKVPVGISLLVVGFVGTASIRGLDIALLQLGRTPFDTGFSYSMSVIALFILMGMVLSYCGLGKDLYHAVDSWIGHVKGGLAMATIGTSAIFAAISGSVNATTATVAKITLPEMQKYNYKPSLSTSCVAAGGTLGILIPPSVVLILYGILTRENIGALLVAGILPGILQMAIFMITIAILIRRDPSLAPVRDEKATLAERFRSLKGVWPIFALFFISVGGIYAGLFTPTEAAGVGAFGAFVFAAITKRLTWENLKSTLDDSVRLTVMIFLILMGANMFGQFLTISRIPNSVTSFVNSLDVNAYVILFLIIFVVFILGLFIDTLSIFVITLSILYPIVTSLGFDGIWFAIIMVLATNIGLLTPPLGVSVFVIKGVAKDIPIQTIFRGAIPMVFAMTVCILLIIIFPQIVTFLPNLMKG